MLVWLARGPGFTPSMAETMCHGAHRHPGTLGGDRSGALSHTQDLGPPLSTAVALLF